MEISMKGAQSKLMAVMPQVKHYANKLDALNEWWGSVALIGKINSHRLASVILDDMQSTREKFGELNKNLIANLLFEHVQKIELNSTAKSQVTIDILIRNLFERTADVAFLATDQDIRAFIVAQTSSHNEQARSDIQARLTEYVKKYSVYDEILILDVKGNVLANLDPENPVQMSTDSLLAETMATSEDYIETFRYSDLRSKANHSLIYSCKITATNEPTSQVLGVLCLCFRFENEMQAIFNSLSDDTQHPLLLLDAKGSVIASSETNLVPLGTRFTYQAEPHLATYQGQEYLVTHCQSHGYQGFYGLGWWAMTMIPIADAFTQQSHEQNNTHSGHDLLTSHLFSQALKDIYRSSKMVNDDLSLVVLNGQVTSLRNEAVEFMPVLEAIKEIGESTASIFADSIYELQNTVLSSNKDDAAFMANLAINIMDRNLYERANDCRWWALTSDFQHLLSKAQITQQEQQQLNAILQYINHLYTVYTNLYLFDHTGKIVAVSDVGQQALIGQMISSESAGYAALKLTTSQQYSVSSFVNTPFYEDRSTYIYNAPVRDPVTQRNVGGIGIVFDSEPEFLAILNDTLPKDDQGNVNEGCFAVFCEPSGKVIAATDSSPCAIGELIVLDDDCFELQAGQQYSGTLLLNEQQYILGGAASSGYREYKTTNDYENDLLAFVFIPI